jgi:hypothetical protein
MGFLRCVGNNTNSYVVVFFLAVEKVFPPEKKLFWQELATGLTLPTYSYVELISLGYPREGGCGYGRESLRRDPYSLGTNPYGQTSNHTLKIL